MISGNHSYFDGYRPVLVGRHIIASTNDPRTPQTSAHHNKGSRSGVSSIIQSIGR